MSDRLGNRAAFNFCCFDVLRRAPCESTLRQSSCPEDTLNRTSIMTSNDIYRVSLNSVRIPRPNWVSTFKSRKRECVRAARARRRTMTTAKNYEPTDWNKSADWKIRMIMWKHRSCWPRWNVALFVRQYRASLRVYYTSDDWFTACDVDRPRWGQATYTYF